MAWMLFNQSEGESCTPGDAANTWGMPHPLELRDFYDAAIQEIYAAMLHIEALAGDLPDGATRSHLLAVSRHLQLIMQDLRGHVPGLQANALQ